MKSKINVLRSYIRKEIKEALNETVYADPNKKNDPQYIAQLRNRFKGQEVIAEMASFYKVKDEDGFKETLKALKDKLGDKIEKFNKSTLGRILNTLDKEGEIDYKELAKKEYKKDIASYNNPNTRKYLENPSGADVDFNFTPYLQAGKKPSAMASEPTPEPHKSEKMHGSENQPEPHKSEKMHSSMPNKSEEIDNEMDDEISDDIMGELADIEVEIQELSKKKNKSADDIKKLKGLKAKKADLESALYGEEEDEDY